MFGETAYPGYLGDFAGSMIFDTNLSGLGGSAWQAAQAAGFTGTKQAWKQAGRPTPPGYVAPPPPPSPVTLPTTEPNQCPPGMTYSPPPPGSGTGTCTGSIIPGSPGVGTPTGTTSSGGGGISDLLSSISPTMWLIIIGVGLFVVLKK